MQISNVETLSELDTFVRVARDGSISKAAASLGVPKSTVSRRVTRLERALGVSLLLRTGRSVKLTDEGARLVQRCEPALSEIGVALDDLSEAAGQVAGRLRVTLPKAVCRYRVVSQTLGGFCKRWPQVELELVATDRMVDIVEEGFDIALRSSPTPIADNLRTRRALSRIDMRLYASRAYLRREGHPKLASDLARHSIIVHRVAQGDGLRLLRGKTRLDLIRKQRGIVVDDESLQLNLCLEGMGIALLPALGARPHLDNGDLEPVLAKLRGPSGALWLVWPQARGHLPRVRAFIDHLITGLEANLSGDSS